jgi:hypothetical protein
MRLSQGFSLVEVLVASLMIMLGVTGYVTLQSEYVLTDSQLNLRNVALQLAEEKLDELTSVSLLNRKAYDDITTNSGGLIPNGKVDVLLGNNQQNLRSFNRTWSVSPLYFIDSDNDGLADLWLSAGHPQLPAQPSKFASQKDVKVTVDWQDFQGKHQSLSMSGRLSPVFQSSSAFVVTESTSIKQSAQIRFTANLLPDSLEQTLTQNNTLQSASPIVLQTGINSEVVMSFERYKNQSGQKIKSSQSDFTTIGCSCQLSGIGMGMTPAMDVIENTKLVTQVGMLVSKMTGSVTATKQSALCQQCCRDHHDSAQTLAAEQYFRSENGSVHGHYKLQTNGSYSPATLAGDVYDEVCRFKRINGDFVLYPDWQLLDILVLSPDFLLNSSNKAAYLAYNEGLLKAAISGGVMPVKPSGRDQAFSIGSFQFTARGLYLDRIRSVDTTLIQTKLAKGEPDWLTLVPFYDVNLTLLADWSSSQPSTASFTNDPIEILINPLQQYYGSFSRGLLTTGKVGSANLSASVTGYNGTMAGLAPVSPFESLSIKQDSSVSIK